MVEIAGNVNLYMNFSVKNVKILTMGKQLEMGMLEELNMLKILNLQMKKNKKNL